MTRAKDISKILTDADISGNIDVDGTTNLDVVDVDGAVNFAADVTFADGADIITASAGTSNTRVGVNAGNSIVSGGNYNVLVGYNAGDAITTGDYNVALGTSSLTTATTADHNTAVGADALGSNTSGTSNVGIGSGALVFTTTGSTNTAVGRNALRANTTAGNNTAVGYQSLLANTTGASNTAVGTSSLDANISGSNLTAVGLGALGANTTASSNTCIGRSSGSQITTGSNNTIIGRYQGNSGGLDIRTSSNNIVLSDGDGNVRVHINSVGTVTCFATSGNYNQRLYSGSNSAGFFLDFRRLDNTQVGRITTDGNTTAYTTSSDYRLKENVVTDWDATTRLKQLKPSRFNFIENPNNTVDGFLAHEVQAIVPEAITGTKDAVDADGNPDYQGIDQSKLVPLLTGALKEAIAKIEDLEARLTTLERE